MKDDSKQYNDILNHLGLSPGSMYRPWPGEYPDALPKTNKTLSRTNLIEIIRLCIITYNLNLKKAKFSAKDSAVLTGQGFKDMVNKIINEYKS